MKKLKWFSGLLILAICSCSNTSKSQDIALNKPYTYSTPPNYAQASKDVNNTLLTDGVYTSSFFWTANTTVGWEGRKRVSIEIDLGQPSPISKVSFNTVRGNAGVEFPTNIFVFTSNDAKIYKYAGDAAVDPDNVHGAYEIKKFTLSGINQTGRYVKLVVLARGSFIFCDEIEVTGGNSRRNSSLAATPGISNVNTAVDSIMKSKGNFQKIRYQIARIRASGSQSSPDLVKAQDLDMTIAEKDLPAVLNQEKSNRLHNLQYQFQTGILIDKVNPWETISAPYRPKGNNDHTYNIIAPVNGVQFGAFTITNLTGNSQVFDFVSQDTTSGIAVTKLYDVPFITTGSDYKEVADPLKTNTRGITLSPGESKMILFKVWGKSQGQINTSIDIQSASFKTRVLLNIQVPNVTLPTQLSLNVNNWAYLTYPLISDRKNEAINDLLKHHINTMVVPPLELPIIGSTDDKGFDNYKDYISNLKPFQNIFLFMDFTNVLYKQQFKKTPYMSTEWKDAFNKWYDRIIQVSNEEGFPQSHIYLYAYDEVRAADIPDFYNFLTWIKVARPDARTYATLVSPDAVNKLMPLVTFAQIPNFKNIVQIGDGSSNHNKIWLYDIKDGAESLSPYSYYRLMAWNAFYHDFGGIGVWDYADYENGTNNKAELKNFDGVNATNYSLIYDGPGKEIISSKRWEAYSLGIEDYQLLLMYAQKFGMANTKQLVETVIDNPDDVTKADAVKNQMLQSLSR